MMLLHKYQWHSQTHKVGRAQLGQLTALIKYLTVLLEYINLLILFAQVTFGWVCMDHATPTIGYATGY